MGLHLHTGRTDRSRAGTRCTMAMIRPRCAATLLGLAGVLCAQPVAAQAAARFSVDLNPRERIQGLSATQAREWNRAVTHVAGLLRAMPSVHTPPEGICTKLIGYVSEFFAAPVMSTQVSVQIPPSYDAVRGCARVSNSGVAINLNGTDGFLRPHLGGMTDEDWQKMYIMPPAAAPIGNAHVYADAYMRWAVLTRDNAPFTIPVSMEARLSHRMKELAGADDMVAPLRARLGALSPAQRSAPACFSGDDLIATTVACAGGSDERPYVRLNRQYFDATLPGAVQLIIVSSRQAIRGKEDPRHFALRSHLFETLDYKALAELLYDSQKSVSSTPASPLYDVGPTPMMVTGRPFSRTVRR
jgi:hypothetical protein